MKKVKNIISKIVSFIFVWFLRHFFSNDEIEMNEEEETTFRQL